ncbi:hypothetical protein C8F04DRAFT_1274049 [Mycena alexandri]|uniref:Uncharacterized protein n=1 Tax=Mycena alexandri TaxID=1745969 RepID=A0AAD6WNK8_9AGAR|nr:hypothetical protein C8F04DRAFT_1274049 [Mycena alexandri]
MLFKAFATVLALTSAAAAGPAPPGPPVFTATRVFQTLTDVAPYIVTATTTVTWTQSPSTSFAHPTGTGLPPQAHHQ